MRSKVVAVSPFYRKIRFITDTLHDDRITVYAAQTAFYICISAIPFIMLLIMLSKLVSPFLVSEIMPVLTDVVPKGAGEVFEYIFSQAMERSDIPLVSTAAVGALWSAARGMRAITRGVSEVYKVSVKGTFISGIFRSLIYTFMFLAIIILTLLFFAFGDVLSKRGVYVVQSETGIFKACLFLLFLTVYFSLLYYVVAKGGLFFRNEKNTSSECPKKYTMQLPGAFLSAVGWVMFSYFYSLYIRYFPKSSYVYGSLGAVVFLMLWLYFCIFIILLGAEVNKFIYLKRKNIPKH